MEGKEESMGWDDGVRVGTVISTAYTSHMRVILTRPFATMVRKASPYRDFVSNTS
jgi:hypothetical protein